MSMRIGKALVVDGDDKIRAAASHLLLTSAGQPFDYASSLLEAVEFLRHNNYVCVFVASEIPAVAGAAPRRQDLENLLEKIDKLKGSLKPPVVCMYSGMAEMDEDDWTCWVADMTLKGVVKWVKKPFPSSGRTPDRILKKILNGQHIRLVKATPLRPVELMAAPLLVGQDEAITTSCSRLPDMDDQAVAAKLRKVLTGKVMDKDGLFSFLRDIKGPNHAAASEMPAPAGDSKAQEPPMRTEEHWPGIANDPIEIDAFMAKFCEPRGRENRMCRKRALMAAARHRRVSLPPPAGGRKHGTANRYFVLDLLAAWTGFLNEGVDLPPLRTAMATSNDSAA